jgi:hypothetical protein
MELSDLELGPTDKKAAERGLQVILAADTQSCGLTLDRKPLLLPFKL